VDDDPLDKAAAPNCPRDLVPLILVDSQRPHWRCTECGLVKL
jgi:hypothetical protein